MSAFGGELRTVQIAGVGGPADEARFGKFEQAVVVWVPDWADRAR